jgi:hypothetical protein
VYYSKLLNVVHTAVTVVSCDTTTTAAACNLQDFRSCLNEKKFQEVLEAVSYQRLVYREQREAALAKEKARQLLRR